MHPGLGDHKTVGGLGADDDDRINPSSAVDADRCIDVVLNVIVAAAAVDQRIGGGQRASILDEEGSHDKPVVPILAEKLQRGLVAVDHELIVGVPAVDRGGQANAPTEETGGRLDCGDLIPRSNVRRGAVGAVHLPELEVVLARAAVQERQRAVVIAVKRIGAAETVDLEHID